jgi:hypothetical protein
VAMLMVISGIFVTPFALAANTRHKFEPHPEERPLGRVSKDAYCPHGSRQRKSASSP